MGLVKDNFRANTVDKCHERYDNHEYIKQLKVNMTLDILDGCVHSCPGCFVNRRGNSVSDETLESLYGIQELFNSNGIRFSSFILGPTDIFGSKNTLELLSNKYLIKAFSNCSTIEMVSTLDMNTFEHISKVIDLFNAIPKQAQGFMYAMQVVVDPYQFISNPFYRDEKYYNLVKVLSLFNNDIDFKLVFNMEGKDLDLAKVSKIAKDEWDCLVEPIPSYQRSTKSGNHRVVTDQWKKTIAEAYSEESKEYIALTIADSNQGAGLEMTYVLSKGEFYSPAFIYDVATIRDEKFRIKDIKDINSWTEIKKDLYLDGMKYMVKTESCSDCPRRHICLNKSVLNYMEHYKFTECVLPMSVLLNYTNDDITAKDK
jgi:hypothetical protein